MTSSGSFAMRRAVTPHHLDARQLQLLLSHPISLERGTSPMVLISIELHGEALLLPVHVELVARDVDVGCGSRQPRVIDELQCTASPRIRALERQARSRRVR
jgi:hypothetical protein